MHQLREIEDILATQAAETGARVAARALASEMTEVVHGAEPRQAVESAALPLFRRIRPADGGTWAVVDAEAGFALLEPRDVTSRGGLDGVALLRRLGLAASNRAASEVIASGGARLNGERMDPNVPVTVASLPERSILEKRKGQRQVIRRGERKEGERLILGPDSGKSRKERRGYEGTSPPRGVPARKG